MNLDPTVGSEIRASPCLVVSPDEMNRYTNTVIVARLAARVAITPRESLAVFRANGESLDQLRTVDRVRLIKRLGRIAPAVRRGFAVLAEMLARVALPLATSRAEKATP